jgi:hypothetical protein
VLSCVASVFVYAGAPLYDDDHANTLWKDCYESNEVLVGSLREDAHEEALHEIALNDYKLGRMSKPEPVNWRDLDKVCRRRSSHVCRHGRVFAVVQVKLVPRFSVEQGVKPDGSVKIRAVDHFSWSAPDADVVGKKRTRKEVKAQSVNGHYTVTDELSHDHLDVLLEAMRLHHETFERVSHSGWHAAHGMFLAHVRCVLQAPGLWKADIDAAFRRVPLKDGHKWAAGVKLGSCRWYDRIEFARAGVAYMLKGVPQIAFHHGMPFGATASVVAWSNIGELIQDIARNVLRIPVFRYVDDYFAAERCNVCIDA